GDETGEADEDEDRPEARRLTEAETQDEPARRGGRGRPEEDERGDDRAGGAGGSPAGPLHEKRHERVHAVDRRAEKDAGEVRGGRLPAPEKIRGNERVRAPRLEPGEDREGDG